MAVITAVPEDFAVMIPLPFTTATDGLLELKVIFPAALAGDREYVSFVVFPLNRVIFDAFNLIALGAGAVTVILQVSFFPFAVVTVIVAVPAFFPVTCPFAFTAATLELLLLHVNVVDAFVGRMAAVRFNVLPITSFAADLLSFTSVTDTGSGVGVDVGVIVAASFVTETVHVSRKASMSPPPHVGTNFKEFSVMSAIPGCKP